MRKICTLFLAVPLVLTAALPARSGDDDRDDDRSHDRDDDRSHERDDDRSHDASTTSSDTSTSRSGGSRKSKLDSDVRVKLQVRHKKAPVMQVRVKVKNRGRLDQSAVLLEVHAGGAGDPTVWQQTLALGSGEHASLRFDLERPASGGTLTATATLEDGDDAPGDNSDATGYPGTTPPVADTNAAGGQLFASLCSSCHGEFGTGGTVHENISRKDAGGILEAVREGEDGMPRFPSLTAADARAIADWLHNPVPVTPVDPPTVPPTVPPVDPPTVPPTDPPTTGAPTYAADVKPILTNRCTVCHQQGYAQAGVRFDTKAKAQQFIVQGLAAIRAGRMPTTGAAVPQSEIDILQAWVDGGKL